MVMFLASLQPWHWVVFALVLLAIESLGVGGFLIGTAIAAFVTALAAQFGLDWPGQLSCFGVLSVVFSVAYWKYFRRFNMHREEEQVVNERMTTLVGKTGKVIEAHDAYSGRAMIGDTLWSYSATVEIKAEDKVKVEGYEGTVLKVHVL